MRTLWILLCISVVIGGILGALQVGKCQSTQGSGADDLLTQSDRCYAVYLRGDEREARRSMLETVRLVETSNKLQARNRAHGLWLSFARLYVLERRAGNDALAEAYLLKTRYWRLIEREAGGMSPKAAGEFLKDDTGDKILEEVDDWDRKHNGGVLPHYVETIRKKALVTTVPAH
jgi:hypothetical protein